MTVIRQAKPSDAPSIAAVHVQSWRETYQGLMPDAVIASRTLDGRTRLWTTLLEEDNAQRNVWVADDQGQIVGFVSGGPCREAPWNGTFPGELYALYLLRSHQGGGLGRALFETCDTWLRAQEGLYPYVLWVLEGNERSLGFYTHLGGKVVVARMAKPVGDGVVLDHCALGWT